MLLTESTSRTGRQISDVVDLVRLLGGRVEAGLRAQIEVAHTSREVLGKRRQVVSDT